MDNESVLILSSAMAAMFALSMFTAFFVLRDAGRRNLNPVFWFLFVMLGPAFIGLIIYLVVRNTSRLSECPYCHQSVGSTHVHCPHCGQQLREVCPQCSMPIEAHWTRCAHCGTDVGFIKNSPSRLLPIREDNRMLYIVIGAIIVCPLLLIAFFVVFFNFATRF